jgi:hypothetical protein
MDRGSANQEERQQIVPLFSLVEEALPHSQFGRRATESNAVDGGKATRYDRLRSSSDPAPYNPTSHSVQPPLLYFPQASHQHPDDHPKNLGSDTWTRELLERQTVVRRGYTRYVVVLLALFSCVICGALLDAHPVHLLVAGSVLSVCSCLVVIYSYLRFPSLQRHPSPLIFYRSFADLLLGVRLMLGYRYM